MRKVVIATLALTLCLAAAAWANPLPFGVSVGGQAAEATSDTTATVPGPVAADAAIVCDVTADMIIINVFPSDEAGNAASDAQPAIIIIQGGNTGALNQTMDGAPLAAGWYLMNIVAGSDTARVVFQVQ